MGAYASQPVTDCDSQDHDNGKIRVGVSSMQGWRRTQEDAMNCCLDFDEENDALLFAVYDGHGGAEVAEYCAKNFPTYLKKSKLYIEGNMEQALEDAFVQFDSTLVDENVITKLKLIANRPESPVPQRLFKISQNQDFDEDENEEDNVLPVPDDFDKEEAAALLDDACTPLDEVLKRMTNGEITGPLTDIKSKSKNSSSGITKLESSDNQVNAVSVEECSHKNGPSDTIVSSSPTDGQPACSSSHNDSPEAGGSGLSNITSNTTELADLDDSSSSGSDYDEGGLDENDSSEDNEDDDSEEEDQETLNKIKISQEMAIKFTESEDYVELPGCDSGCTACLAMIRGNKLYVANAGDSRCVLSRNGKAVDLSVDHKPEDDSEKQRIEKAGGFVSPDGRVNGNLNLSRAIGDHNYKRNKSIPLKDQMITALPDIRTTLLTAEDEFIILACDGIWNSVTSQDCVDFVRNKLERGEKLSIICEDLFHYVLAEDTLDGDGTGCDNMTCIIIDLQRAKHLHHKNERTSSTGFDHTIDDDDNQSLNSNDEPPRKLHKAE